MYFDPEEETVEKDLSIVFSFRLVQVSTPTFRFISSSTLIEDQNLSQLTNHPVHVIDKEPTSSFIPFCWLGVDLDVSRESERFSLSVCNSFKPKLRNDQVCYEMDPNDFLKKDQSSKNLVLYLILDENKDRQILDSIKVPNNQNMTKQKQKENFLVDFGNEKETFIYLDTIGDIVT